MKWTSKSNRIVMLKLAIPIRAICPSRTPQNQQARKQSRDLRCRLGHGFTADEGIVDDRITHEPYLERLESAEKPEAGSGKR